MTSHDLFVSFRRGFRQKECNSSALDFLRQRHRDVVRMQRLMEANIQSCAPAAVALSHSGPRRTQSNLLQPQEQLWAQPEEKAHLDSVMSKEEPEQRADGPLTQDWDEVLRKAEQWQKEAQLTTEVKGACDIRGKNCAYSLLSMDCHKLKSRNSLYSYNEVRNAAVFKIITDLRGTFYSIILFPIFHTPSHAPMFKSLCVAMTGEQP